jgi:hypothetical protein
LLSLAADLIKNRDYHGVEIAHEDDKFAMLNIERGQHVIDAFLPFWMRGEWFPSISRRCGEGQI